MTVATSGVSWEGGKREKEKESRALREEIKTRLRLRVRVGETRLCPLSSFSLSLSVCLSSRFEAHIGIRGEEILLFCLFHQR